VLFFRSDVAFLRSVCRLIVRRTDPPPAGVSGLDGEQTAAAENGGPARAGLRSGGKRPRWLAGEARLRAGSPHQIRGCLRGADHADQGKIHRLRTDVADLRGHHRLGCFRRATRRLSPAGDCGESARQYRRNCRVVVGRHRYRERLGRRNGAFAGYETRRIQIPGLPRSLSQDAQLLRNGSETS
jgi:hypothetical protein